MKPLAKRRLPEADYETERDLEWWGAWCRNESHAGLGLPKQQPMFTAYRPRYPGDDYVPPDWSDAEQMDRAVHALPKSERDVLRLAFAEQIDEWTRIGRIIGMGRQQAKELAERGARGVEMWLRRQHEVA